MSDLPPAVSAFLRGHIASVLALEVLFELRQRPEGCSVTTLTRRLGGSPDAVIAALRQLERSKLVAQQDSETDLMFQFAPDASLVADLDELYDTYTRRKVAVIAEIYRAPDDPLQSFSNAFRLRRRH